MIKKFIEECPSFVFGYLILVRPPRRSMSRALSYSRSPSPVYERRDKQPHVLG